MSSLLVRQRETYAIHSKDWRVRILTYCLAVLICKVILMKSCGGFGREGMDRKPAARTAGDAQWCFVGGNACMLARRRSECQISRRALAPVRTGYTFQPGLAPCG